MTTPNDNHAVLDLRPVMVALRTRLATILVSALVVAGLVAAWALASPQRYEARTVLAAVGSSRLGLSLPAGVAGLLGGGSQLAVGGVQATPDMVGYLLNSETVLLRVARRPAPVRGTLGERVAGGSLEELGAERMLRNLRRRLQVTIVHPTGLITLTVNYPDSAVARSLASGVVEETQRLFASVTSSQAGQFRRAQEARVDSAKVILAAAEEVLLRFNEENRVVVGGSRLALQRTRLERAVVTAQSVFQSAVSDRESARARELEDTPALAVVEPMPARIPIEDRHALARSAFAGLVAGAVLLILYFLAELLRAPMPASP
jgi:hypothetical protein